MILVILVILGIVHRALPAEWGGEAQQYSSFGTEYHATQTPPGHKDLLVHVLPDFKPSERHHEGHEVHEVGISACLESVVRAELFAFFVT